MLSELQKLRKEKAKAEAKGEWREAAAICNCIGQELVRLGKYEDAKASHFEELEYCSMLNDELGKAVANRKIGECYAEMSDFKRALHHQTKFLEIAVSEKSLVEQQRAWATLGRTYFIKYQQELTENKPKEVRQESLSQAEKSFCKALKLAHSIKSEVSPKEYEEMRARLLLNIGLVYEQRGDLDKCSENIRLAIFLAKKNNLYEDLHRCQYSLASVYQRCKQHELALRVLDEAISSARALKDKSYICEALSSKAQILLLLKDFEAAKNYLKKAYKIRSPVDSDQAKIETHLKIVVSICECERSLLTARDPTVRKPLLEKIADALATLECYKVSIDYYLLTLKCLETMNAAPSAKAAIYYSVAQTYVDDNNYAEALKYLQKEIDCNENRPIEQVKTFWKMADVLEIQDNISDAETMLLKSLNLAERLEDKRSVGLSLKRLHNFYKSFGDAVKMANIEKRLGNFDDIDSEEDDDDEEMDTEKLFDEVPLSELLSDSSDSENESSVVKRFKRSSKLEARRNELGETVLHRACIAGKLNLVKQLVENGHSVNVRDNCGWSPLHEACNHGYYEIVEYLISKGANINDRGGPGCHGVTPLIDAASCGNLDVMELLLSKNASVTMKNDFGSTALDELIKWRQRCEGDLEEVLLRQSNSLESHLRSLMRQAGVETPNLGTTELESESLSEIFSEDSCGSNKSSRANEKRNHSSSSSEDEEIYDNPHLDWDKENDFNDPQNVKSSYQAVMSSFRHNVKRSGPPEPLQLKEPLPALIEKNDDQGWLIADGSSKGKVQPKKKRKQQKISHYTNRKIDQHFGATGSDSDSFQSLPQEHEDRSSYKISADESSIGESSYADSRSSFTEAPRSFSVRVRVTDKIIFVPILNESLTIDWLAKETSNRFLNLSGKKPILNLMKKDGAYLCPTDIIHVVLQNNEELITSVTMWEQVPLLELYKQNCAKMNIHCNQPVENRLRPFEVTSELNFSDICLPTSQLMVMLKSLDTHHKLSHLNLSNNDIEDVLDHFISCIPSLQSLLILNLSCCGLTVSSIRDISKCLQQSSVPLFPTLQKLCLSYNSFVPETAKYLSIILNMLGLKVLKLHACDIDEEFFTDHSFCDSLRTSDLRELDMSTNTLGSVGVSRLLSSLPRKNLFKLDLSYTVPNVDSIMPHLCRYFSQPMPELHELNLEACHLKNADIISLSETLKFCPKLSFINLSSNPGLSGEVFLKLVETSHAHVIPLTMLYAISCCTWNEETAKNFCKAFQTRLLRNVVLDCIPEPLHEQMYGVWRDVWGNGISFNDMVCEFSVDSFMTIKGLTPQFRIAAS